MTKFHLKGGTNRRRRWQEDVQMVKCFEKGWKNYLIVKST